MGHPNRKILKDKKRSNKERMLERKNHYNVLDLTPHNAIGFTQFKSYQLKLK